jgi:hypothetical protein
MEKRCKITAIFYIGKFFSHFFSKKNKNAPFLAVSGIF